MSASGFEVTVVVAQCVSCLVLTGLALVVQLVVYPGFETVGRAAPAAWSVVHEQHSRRIAQAVSVPWLIEGLTCAALLAHRPPQIDLWQALAVGALGLGTVLSTLGWAIPLHNRLAAGYDDRAARALLQANGLRLALWAAAGGLSVVMLVEV